ncbi:MAG: hypothetical protein ACE147_18535 [Candidatus Methylomirabilales bacterium]
MFHGRMLRSLSPQARLALYTNRIVRAVWTLILAGVVTALEPFTQLYARLDVSLGLVAPNVLTGALGRAPGSALHAGAAALCGLLMAGLGILAGYNHTRALVLGAGVLVWDLALVFIAPGWRRMPADALFPLIVTVTIRLVVLGYLGSGLLAVGRRYQLAQKMQAADREYEAAQQKKKPQPPAQGKGKQYTNTEEDAYQG